MTSAAAAGSPVDGILATASIVLSLAIAVWALVAALRNRPPDRVSSSAWPCWRWRCSRWPCWHWSPLGGGERPGEPGAFFGYLVTLVCLPPLAGVLARMEPTRWGSAIVCAVCLVTPVVVVRLQQTWEVLGG